MKFLRQKTQILFPLLALLPIHLLPTSFSLIEGDLVAPGGVLSNSEDFFIDGVVIASESDNSESVPEPASILGLLALGGVALISVYF